MINSNKKIRKVLIWIALVIVFGGIFCCAQSSSDTDFQLGEEGEDHLSQMFPEDTD